MKHQSGKMHPHHQGAGMPYFRKDHWEKNVEDVQVADGKYASEMNAAEEYKRAADGLAQYAKKHRAQH